MIVVTVMWVHLFFCGLCERIPLTVPEGSVVLIDHWISSKIIGNEKQDTSGYDTFCGIYYFANAQISKECTHSIIHQLELIRLFTFLGFLPPRFFLVGNRFFPFQFFSLYLYQQLRGFSQEQHEHDKTV